jgi:PPK2 family polyphosphate:nucleotide phosphotransferase
MSGKINLDSISTVPSDGFNKENIEKENEVLIKKLSDIQNKLYAQRKFAVLIVLQGMDASGKDGAVKNVFSGVNPAGCMVKSFKSPNEEELGHHFLWRINKNCPEKGMIQIFNRSHYEDILVPAVLGNLTEKKILARCEEINAFEKGLTDDNTIILKYYLHVSHEEQLKRLEDRKTDLHKRWKYQKEDIAAIAQHHEYKKVYENIFENCSNAVPWKIIPADKKWYKNYAILKTIVEDLTSYPIDYPIVKL